MPNQAPFYDDHEKDLLENYSNMPSSSFRVWKPCLRVPFYEVHLWGGYLTEAYEYGYRHNIKEEKELEKIATWREAMKFSKWGFTEKAGHFAETMKVRISITGGPMISSPWSLKSCHHYSAYEKLSGNDINSFERIVEWGGGSGDFARFVFDMGFKGEYIIADLPGTSLISKANLSQNPDHYKVTWTTTPPPESDKKTLFVSTWALSETPMDLRVEVMNTVRPDNHLIIYQSTIWDYDNELFFGLWPGEREDVPWIYWGGGSQLIAY